MIGSLRGTVIERLGEGQVLVEAAGVGYIVHVTPRVLAELEPTSPVFLHVHHHIREDQQTLFGFLHRDERMTFQTLLSTHGIGPALALAILATHTPMSLFDIVASGDTAALTLVPGVGKKTAERLMIELKSRLTLPVLPGNVGDVEGSVVGAVREALIGLGYSETEARDALRDAPMGTDREDLLRQALRVLGSRRA
ncbi:MAG: Holliday junction branch migration protein RuvA [Ilumatobacteraceae bacterium]